MEIQNKYCWCLLVYSCYVVVHKYNVHTLTPLLLFSDNNTHTHSTIMKICMYLVDRHKVVLVARLLLALVASTLASLSSEATLGAGA